MCVMYFFVPVFPVALISSAASLRRLTEGK